MLLRLLFLLCPIFVSCSSETIDIAIYFLDTPKKSFYSSTQNMHSSLWFQEEGGDPSLVWSSLGGEERVEVWAPSTAGRFFFLLRSSSGALLYQGSSDWEPANGGKKITIGIYEAGSLD